MGNTIRRQPISFKIPDSPDYKYLNLTSFAGLHQTDNPFTAQANSASDVLNVYVDENNALTTRPRVADKIDFSKTEGEIVASYRLSDKTYIKIKQDSVINLYDDTGKKFDLADGIVLNETEFSMLNYNGTLILFDDTQILVYENDVWVMAKDWSELPIPLTVVNKTKTNPSGIVNETQNLLTTKHRESYALNTTQTTYEGNEIVITSEFSTDYIAADMLKNNGKLYKNGYVKKIYSMPSTAHAISLYDDGSFTYYDETGLKLGTIKNNEVSVVDTNVHDTNIWGVGHGTNYANAKSLRNFIVEQTTNGKEYYLVTESTYTKGSFSVRSISINNDAPAAIKGMCYSPSGTYYWVLDTSNRIEKWVGTYSAASLRSTQTIDEKLSVTHMVCDDSDVLFIKAYDIGNNKTIIYKWDVENNFTEYVSYSGTRGGALRLSREKNELYIAGFEKKITTTLEKPEIMSLSFSDQYGQAISYSGDVFYSTDNRDGEWKVYFSGQPSEKPSVSLQYDVGTIGNADDQIFTAKDERYVIAGLNVYSQSLYSTQPLYEVLYEHQNNETTALRLTNNFLFDNTFWYYSTNSNIVRWNSGDNPLYIPENNYDEVGDEKPLTNALIISENTLGLFKKDKTYTATPATINEQYTYLFTELTNDYGCYSPHGAVVSPLRNIPIVVGLNEISGLYSSENISKVNRYYSSLSLDVDKQYRKTDDKNKRYFVPEEIWASNIKYWSVFACNSDFGSRWLIFDDRTSDWFYWEVPAKVDNLWSDNDKLYFLSNKDKKIRAFETSDIIHPQNPELTEYYDLNRKLIKWHWTSQILPLGTINHYKKLIDTTFIVSDTEANDSYGLNYTFRAYRKNISESDLNTIKNELQYVQSVTKKTLISRFNFLQFEISHTEDDDQLNNNKLRLIGMALKYVLLGGIMQ